MIRVFGVDDHPPMTAGIAGGAIHAGKRVIQLVSRGNAKGVSNRRIAVKLNITEHTVKAHLKNILAKLDSNDRAYANVIALKRGMLDL